MLTPSHLNTSVGWEVELWERYLVTGSLAHTQDVLAVVTTSTPRSTRLLWNTDKKLLQVLSDIQWIANSADSACWIQRIRGQVPDSCLSCEFSILWEGIEFIKWACGEPCFSTSKDDSLDKKQIQIIVVIVVKVVKLIFYFQNTGKPPSAYRNERWGSSNLRIVDIF